MNETKSEAMWLEQWDVAQAAVQAACDELSLTTADEADARQQLPGILKREIPRFIKFMTLMAALESGLDRDEKYFKRKGVPIDRAEDLAQITAERILKCFYSAWPHGNIGAWKASVRHNILVDYRRGRDGDNERIDWNQDPLEVADKSNPIEELEVLETVWNRCSPFEREIVERRLSGEDWESIAVSAGRPTAEMNAIARRACLPVTSPKGKRRPRKDRT